MRKVKIKNKGSIETNQSYEAEPLEKQIAKLLEQKQPIEGGAPMIYTEKKNGVEPQYDIRTDRFEIAQQAMEKVTGMLAAKREEKPETPKAEEVDKPANNDPTKTE